MRITALSSVLAIGVVGALTHATPAHADRKKPLAARPDVAAHPVLAELAALVDPARAPRTGSLLSTGELGLTAARAPAPTAGAADGTLLAVAPALRDRPERYLTTGDVATVVGDRAADIERCYLDAMGAARRGGKLDVMFTIARNGSVLSVDTAAPGLSAVAAHRMHTCIRTAVEGLAFPARRNDTTAIVPYYFQRTDAPDAGPQLSCWNPRGC
ncbi:MAG TPA: AgmX/PglI C-terminal domain-containing protein [Kofleriaceae bacterium]|nr:AgmX/PglI C-terminal domain-containing protein [Kofleriaceae bacterium]